MDFNIQTNVILNTYFIKVKISKMIVVRRVIFVCNLEDKAYKTINIEEDRGQRAKLKTKKNIGLLNCEQIPVIKEFPIDYTTLLNDKSDTMIFIKRETPTKVDIFKGKEWVGLCPVKAIKI